MANSNNNGFTLAADTDLYEAIISDIMDDDDVDREEAVERVEEFICSILWNALESR